MQLIVSALNVVAEHGSKAATVRRIAADARVTPGLVVHHFGTKQRLFAEVDEHVINRLEQAMKPPRDDLPVEEVLDSIATALSDVIGGDAALRGYLRRSFLEATPAGMKIFRQLVDVTSGLIVRYLPSEAKNQQRLYWSATQVLAINLAGLLFEPLMEYARAPGPFSPTQLKRRTEANLRFIVGGLTAISGESGDVEQPAE